MCLKCRTQMPIPRRCVAAAISSRLAPGAKTLAQQVKSHAWDSPMIHHTERDGGCVESKGCHGPVSAMGRARDDRIPITTSEFLSSSTEHAMAYEDCPQCGERKHQLMACPKCGFTRATWQETLHRRPEPRPSLPSREESPANGVKVIVRRRKLVPPDSNKDSSDPGRGTAKCKICGRPAMPGQDVCLEHDF